MPASKEISFRVFGRVLRLGKGGEATTWPWPFLRDDDDGPAWKARYAPDKLTPSDLMELASIADAYRTLITHPVRSVRENIFVLHRAWKMWIDQRD